MANTTIIPSLGTTRIITPTNRGLVAYWSFDEGSGPIVRDYSGNNHNGTMINSPTRITGIMGKAMSFDGVNDYVVINHSSLLELPLPFSISIWVRFTTTSNLVVGPEKNGNSGYSVQCGVGSPSGRISLTCGSSNRGVVSTIAINDGKWHHVVFLSILNAGKVYVDNIDQTTVQLAGNITTPSYGASTVVYLGGRATVGPFAGSLDQVRMYNRTLSLGEISILYQSGLTNTNFN